MKKLMILVLVFGLASVTNAALVLSLDGNTDIDEITVAPSESFIVDVYSTDGLDAKFWVNVAGPASYTGAGTVYSPPAPATMYPFNYSPGWIKGEMDSPSIGAIGTWWDLELHCDGEGDVTIKLYDPTGYIVIDSAVIHQVPEPITIALLGLGGLFLRRRK